GGDGMDASLIPQLVLNGLAQGAIYGLVAPGSAVVFKATGILNFAQGGLIMIAAYLTTTPMAPGELPFAPGLIGVVAIMCVLCVFLYAVIFKWLVGKEFFASALVTIGLEIVLFVTVIVFWGTDQRYGPGRLASGTFDIGSSRVPRQNLAIVLISLA